LAPELWRRRVSPSMRTFSPRSCGSAIYYRPKSKRSQLRRNPNHQPVS